MLAAQRRISASAARERAPRLVPEGARTRSRGGSCAERLTSSGGWRNPKRFKPPSASRGAWRLRPLGNRRLRLDTSALRRENGGAPLRLGSPPRRYLLAGRVDRVACPTMTPDVSPSGSRRGTARAAADRTSRAGRGVPRARRREAREAMSHAVTTLLDRIQSARSARRSRTIRQGRSRVMAARPKCS